MKKIALLLLVIFLSVGITHAQRVLIDENFESTVGIGTDSLPAQWAKFKVNGTGLCTWAVWGARDSGQVMCGTNTYCGFYTKAHLSKRALNIPWTCTSSPISDDWVFTKSVTIAANDSLIFWMQLGTYPCSGSYYTDSCQIWISTNQNPSGGTKTKLGTVSALPAASNVWQNIKYNLSAFAGQTVYIGFRYYMDLSVDGIMVNLDDVFVGNRSAGGGVPTGVWTEQTSGLTTVLYSVSAVNDDVAWVCGAGGKVLRTTNKGINWADVSGTIPTTYALYNVFAWDANLCVITGVAGSNTSIFQTSNGGTTWTTANTHAGFGDDMFMTSATDAYFIGDPSGGNWDLLKSTNAGLNWGTWSTVPTTNTSGTYNNAAWYQGTQVWFESVGLSTIHYTSNLGANWVAQTIPLSELTAICFSTPTVGLAGGSSTSPGLLKSTDAGTTWTALTNPYATSSISGIVGAQTTWWVAQQGTGISISTNDGTSFTTAYTAPAGNYYHMTKSRAGATIWAIRSNGGISRYGLPPSGVSPISSEIPSSYSLSQNYPNPFNPVTKITFALPKSGLVTLKVYDITGKEVAALVNEVKNAGIFIVDFDGSSLSSGTYFYRLESNGFVATKKMLLVK